MDLSFQPMTEHYARLLLTWRYAEPYAIYSMQSDDAEISTDPANAYWAVTDADGDLLAFRCFGAVRAYPFFRCADAQQWYT